jgi:MFS family permease
MGGSVATVPGNAPLPLLVQMWYNGAMTTILERRVAARLPHGRLERARLLFIWEGSLATGFVTCTSGTILIGFALWMGATPFHIGLLTSLPAFAALAQLLAPYFTERQGQRKRLMTLMTGGQRALWLAVAALPFLVLPPSISLVLLVALVTVSAMLGAIGAVPWLSWMADLVPRDMRGRYFATRNLIMGTVGLFLGPVIGLFLDRWQGWAGAASPFGFEIVFVAGAALGLLAVWLLQHITEPPMVQGSGESLFRQLILPWKNADFRRLIFFRGYYIFMVNLAGPFFVVYYLQGLGLNFGTVYVLQTIGLLSMLVALKSWGHLCDRWGPRKVLLVNAIGKGVYPLFYVGMAVTSPGSPTLLTWLLLLVAQVSCVFEGGMELAANNLQLNMAPREHNTAYLATYAAVFSLCSAVSPLIGGALLSHPAAAHMTLGPLDLAGFQVLFLVSGLLRLGAVFLARRVRE